MDVPLTSHASQIYPERFKTASADAEMEAMADVLAARSNLMTDLAHTRRIDAC